THLESLGWTCSLISASSTDAADAVDADAVSRICRQAATESPLPCKLAVHLRSLDMPRLEDLTPATLLDVQVLSCGSALHLLQELIRAARDNQIGFRRGERFLPQIVKAAAAEFPDPHLKIVADSSYLVTGGTGGLGLHVVRWLVQEGAAHIAIVSRTRPSGE